jgi:hypothetical protein
MQAAMLEGRQMIIAGESPAWKVETLNYWSMSMAVFKNYKIAKLRSLADKLGREGVSIEVIKAIKGWDGSYKGAMELCGKLTLWADASTFDEYWNDQVNRGMSKAISRACELEQRCTK